MTDQEGEEEKDEAEQERGDLQSKRRKSSKKGNQGKKAFKLAYYTSRTIEGSSPMTHRSPSRGPKKLPGVKDHQGSMTGRFCKGPEGSAFVWGVSLGFSYK